MADVLRGGFDRQELVNIIRHVRARWRTKLLLRGGLILVGGGLLALFLASWGLHAAKFSPAAVLGFRIAIFAVFATLAGFWLVKPLRRRVTDMQVALYIEEHDPKLQAAMLSAVEVGAAHPAGPTESTPVIDRLVDQAVEKCRSLEGGKAVGQRAIQRHATGLAVVGGVTLLLLVVGPDFFRQGASALLNLSKTAEAASPYTITVKPGNVTVPRGSAQQVTARLTGFQSTDVALMVKAEGESDYTRLALLATGDANMFEGMLFNVKKPIDYYIESDDVRSATYHMKVIELPAVEKLELEYVFPAYTGLPPQKVDSTGDVAALRGTEVRVRITPTMPTTSGRLQVEPSGSPELAAQPDGTLTGSFQITQSGFYHVELDSSHGDHVAASPKYTVDMIADQPPTVRFDKPRRDISASPVEEVELAARADDDFGVKQLDLVYSVNGGPDKTVSLYGNGAKPLLEVTGTHTIYLEELAVKPGDFVSYYAKAYDNDTVSGPKSASSDIYFVKILPFDMAFREAQSQAGGGGGGRGGNQVGLLSDQEKQIISATFNTDRDRAKTPPDKFQKDTVFIGLAQAKLRDQVTALLSQIQQRLAGDQSFAHITEALPKAADQMKEAEGDLKAQKTKEALGPELRALKYLQDAEQAYELEVRRAGGGGGGGGGGQSQMAQDLADLFQMELDRNANQYELQQRAQDQSTNQQVDDVAQRVRELARRQLQQVEQQLRAQQQGGSGSGSGERSLADEAEQMARQLEQLQRDAQKQGQQRQDLADAAKRLQQAADAMRRAATDRQANGAQAQQAQQALEDARRILDQANQNTAGQSMSNALQQADALLKQQQDISSRVSKLDQAGADKDAQMKQLTADKDQEGQKLNALQQQLGQLANQATADNQRDAARKAQEAAASANDNMLKEKIEYSKEAMAAGSQYTKPLEDDITGGMQTFRNKVADAATAANKAQQGQGMTQAANQATDMVRGLQQFNNEVQGQQANQSGQPNQQDNQGQAQNGQGQQAGPQGQQGQGQGQQGQAQNGQGQGRNQGQQGQGRPGQPGQQNGGPGGATSGPQNPNASGQDRPFSAPEISQYRAQAGQLASQAQQLGQQLKQAGANQKDQQTMDEISQALRDMAGNRAYDDSAALRALNNTTLDKMKKLEFDLRKQIDTSNQQLYLSGSQDVPPAFRTQIEDYYRALSKKPGGTAPPPAPPGGGRGGGGF